MAKVVIPGKLDWGGVCHICTTRSTSRKGNGSMRTLLTMLKMAVFAPMPRAMMRAAVRAKPGFFMRSRSANRRSCRSDDMHLPPFALGPLAPGLALGWSNSVAIGPKMEGEDYQRFFE